jgi:hypothetical protein
MPVQGGLDRRRLADERDLHVEVTRCRDRPVDDRRRRVVTAHRVHGESDQAYSSLTARTWRCL